MTANGHRVRDSIDVMRNSNMSAAIILPDILYHRLAAKSHQLERSPEMVVADLVQQYLDEAESNWQAEFEALLARVHARSRSYAPTEIEADITVAASEVKEARRARRSR